ncbi:MAG: hypothetical protein KDD36_01420 [Flavobacteriales bacterium]|nr:hypothetical protein [Flavobacteriales bacterium]
MKPYIITDRSSPTSEEIRKRQDFSKVVDSYQLTQSSLTLGKWLKWGGYLAGTCALVISSYFLLQSTEENPPVKKEISSISPDLPGQSTHTTQPRYAARDIAFTTYQIDSKTDVTINHPSGSTISIPAGCLVNASGETVSGSVEIHYREIMEPMGIFASGIPMHYDTLNETHHFESAGMIEIRAYQNGQSLSIKPEKTIHISMHSQDQRTLFNLYHLDDQNTRWDCQGKDIVTVATQGLTPIRDMASPMDITENQALTELDHQVQNARKLLAQCENSAPSPPKKAVKGKPKFNIEVDTSQFPEMKSYDHIVFQVADSEKNFDPNNAHTTWQNVSLERTSTPGIYKVIFSRPDRTISVLSEPVLSGIQFEAAQSRYEELFTEYNQKLLHRKREEEKAIEAYEKALAEQAHIIKEREETRRLAAKQVSQTRAEIKRTFSINQFGIYNCDHPRKSPQGCTLQATFKDTEGQPLQYAEVCLVDRKLNAVFVFNYTNFDRLSFDPASENMIWAVTAEGGLTYFGPDAFAEISRQNKSFTFVMTYAKENDLTMIDQWLADKPPL